MKAIILLKDAGDLYWQIICRGGVPYDGIFDKARFDELTS